MKNLDNLTHLKKLFAEKACHNIVSYAIKNGINPIY